MIEMDNDMDVGAPVDAVNEPPEVKAEKEKRPGKKTAKNATARPASRTAGKPSSRAKAAPDGADQTGMVPAVNDTRSEAVADKPASGKKPARKPVAKMNRNAPKNRKDADKNDAGNVFRFVTSDGYDKINGEGDASARCTNETKECQT